MLVKSCSAWVAAWALVAAGCGGSGADTGTSPPTPAAATQAPEAGRPEQQAGQASTAPPASLPASSSTSPAPADELAARCAAGVKRVSGMALNFEACRASTVPNAAPVPNARDHMQCGGGVVADFVFCGQSRVRTGEAAGAGCTVVKTGAVLTVIAVPELPNGESAARKMTATLDQSDADTVNSFDTDQGRVNFLTAGDEFPATRATRSAIKLNITAGELRGLDYAVEYSVDGVPVISLNCALPTGQ